MHWGRCELVRGAECRISRAQVMTSWGALSSACAVSIVYTESYPVVQRETYQVKPKL